MKDITCVVLAIPVKGSSGNSRQRIKGLHQDTAGPAGR